MTWIKVDDHFDEHPKMAAIGPTGWGVWLGGLAYSNRNLTDGFIPQAIAWRFQAEKVVGQLVQVGLWSEVAGGFQIHDYAQYQPSREQVFADRKRAAERQKRFRNGRVTT